MQIPIPIRLGASMALAAVVIQLPSPGGMPIQPDLKIIIDVAKLVAWGGITYSCLKMAIQLHQFYWAFYALLIEHRLLAADLWERKPEKQQEFDIILNRVPSRAKAAKNGR